MKKYTLNLANSFYFIFTFSLCVWILLAAKVVIVPLVFSFFLP